MFSFFLNLLQRKICWGGKFSSTTGKDFIRKNGLPKIYKGEKEHLGSRDLEELPKSIYSLLWFQLTVENKLFSSTKIFVKGRYKF